MSAKHQKIEIEIPTEYGPAEREAIAFDIVEHIRKRTQKKGLDKNNRPFAKYSKEYVESLDFKIAGKSKGKTNLTLSGDMMGALDLLNHKRGKLVIGFERGSDENNRADGNIRGTYGQDSQIAPKRDFLGITKGDLKSILSKYPAKEREKTRERARRRQAAGERAADAVSIDAEDLSDG